MTAPELSEFVRILVSTNLSVLSTPAQGRSLNKRCIVLNRTQSCDVSRSSFPPLRFILSPVIGVSPLEPLSSQFISFHHPIELLYTVTRIGNEKRKSGAFIRRHPHCALGRYSRVLKNDRTIAKVRCWSAVHSPGPSGPVQGNIDLRGKLSIQPGGGARSKLMNTREMFAIVEPTSTSYRSVVTNARTSPWQMRGSCHLSTRSSPGRE